MAQTMPATPTARTHCTPTARLASIWALCWDKKFLARNYDLTRNGTQHRRTHTNTHQPCVLVKPSSMCEACGKPPPLSPLSCLPCLPRQPGSGTKLIWLAPGQITLTGSTWQPSDDKWTHAACTHTHTLTHLTAGQLHTLRIRNLLEHTHECVCVYRIIDIFISPPFRHKANLLIRAICSTCPQLVVPSPSLLLFLFHSPSLSSLFLLPLFTSCGFSTWHKFCGVNYEA